MKVIVGMSGGVDSSVAASLLQKEGHEVAGLSLTLYEARAATRTDSCCGLEAVGSAQSTAKKLGIAHSCLDARGLFIEKVIEPFIEAYSNGLTPNPCVLCNRHVKFPLLLEEAKRTGADLIATGHYARVGKADDTQGSPPLLKQAAHLAKDQSYFLYALSREELKRLVLPLGAMTKDNVRDIARRLGLPAAQRVESQEICFVGEGKYSDFIASLTDFSEGPILDTAGNKLGTHKGIHCYTLGQRRGLGVSNPEPLYVIRLHADTNTLVVGTKEEAMGRDVLVSDLHWLVQTPPEFTAHEFRGSEFRVGVKIRSMMAAAPATVKAAGAGTVQVTFDKPQWAAAPGQSAVFYDSDVVLGGGIVINSI